jgi:hypothetical protein
MVPAKCLPGSKGDRSAVMKILHQITDKLCYVDALTGVWRVKMKIEIFIGVDLTDEHITKCSYNYYVQH